MNVAAKGGDSDERRERGGRGGQKKFEFLDITTADVAFAAYGRSLGELFANAALAMFEVMIDTGRVEPRVERRVEVEGNDLQSLMFNWLNGLLVYVDSENLAFSEFDVDVDEGGMKSGVKLVGVCRGERMDPKRHELRTEVKATTYHKMEIKKDGKGGKGKKGGLWRAQVILDI